MTKGHWLLNLVIHMEIASGYLHCCIDFGELPVHIFLFKNAHCNHRAKYQWRQSSEHYVVQSRPSSWASSFHTQQWDIRNRIENWWVGRVFNCCYALQCKVQIWAVQNTFVSCTHAGQATLFSNKHAIGIYPPAAFTKLPRDCAFRTREIEWLTAIHLTHATEKQTESKSQVLPEVLVWPWQHLLLTNASGLPHGHKGELSWEGQGVKHMSEQTQLQASPGALVHHLLQEKKMSGS